MVILHAEWDVGKIESVDDPANALLLRADLQTAFGKPSFVCFPIPTNVISQQFVLHLLVGGSHFENLNSSTTIERCRAGSKDRDLIYAFHIYYSLIVTWLPEG